VIVAAVCDRRHFPISAFQYFRFQNFHCGFTEPTLASGQLSARFRPRTMTDSPALHPLHSNRSSPAFRHKIHWLHAWLPLIRSVGRKLARQSKTVGRVPKIQETRGRDAPHIGQVRQYGRETSSGQDISNSPRVVARGPVGAGSACRRGQAIGPRGFARCKTPALTVSTAIFRPLHSAGLRSLLSRIALVAINPASIPLRPIGGNSDR
jgi:hypothetical protein